MASERATCETCRWWHGPVEDRRSGYLTIYGFCEWPRPFWLEPTKRTVPHNGESCPTHQPKETT